MAKPYYVVLTGHKVNAGDFVIRHKVLDLLQKLRPDREVINFPAWEEFDDARLAVVNQAKALILAGGPALQADCYPRIYPLRKNLTEILVPTALMGVGTKPYDKDLDYHNYRFSESTQHFLNFIQKSKVSSSVRDFHSLHTLQKYNFTNVMMTGCPVLYDFDHLYKPVTVNLRKKKKIVFSMGVSFVKSHSMAKLMKDMVSDLKKRFAKDDFKVAFHHSLIPNSHQSSDFTAKNREMAAWLDSLAIPHVEISGGLDGMLNLYHDTDLHIGFRLHAHLLMCSWSKCSVLFAEDGRAIGFKDVIHGDIHSAYKKMNTSVWHKVLNRIIPQHDPFAAFDLNELHWDTILQEPHLLKSCDQTRELIDRHFESMRHYIQQLP